jgi:polyisoprenoid-binding protein YceI
MKLISKITIAFFVIALIIPGTAQDAFKLKKATMTVAGTSSLHDWVSNVTEVNWSGSIDLTGNTVGEIQNAVIKIPVKSLKSTKGRMMDNKTYDAFNYEKYPYIIFKVSECKISGNTMKVSGYLSMASKTRSIELTVSSKASDTELQLTGSTTLNMKDYSMEPPTAMMGAITVGEEVTIDFDITLTQSNTK